MEKCTLATTAAEGTQIFRVVPPYGCDTWEVTILLGVNDPRIHIFSLDDEYSGSGEPGLTEKHELTTLEDIGPYGDTAGGGFVAADLPQHFTIDRAWKGLQFTVTDVGGGTPFGTAIVKVKAYRAGKCTFQGTYTTSTAVTT